MKERWREAISQEWQARSATRVECMRFPLVEASFDADEIAAIFDALFGGRLTMLLGFPFA